MKKIITTNKYCRSVFGEQLYKLSLSAATDCPNRRAEGGCIFCSEGGSGEFAAPAAWDIDRQIEYAKRKVSAKYSGQRYIAYFQSYTGTYGELSHLREMYLAAAKREDIAALSIATRPDCLGPEVMEMLSELSSVKPLWVELGLQSGSDDTAKRIRRGYLFEEYEAAVCKLRTLPIHIITHVILGLPGEDREQMLCSVRAAAIGDGIKLQLLHVLKGTELEKWYYEGRCKVLSPQEYYDIVAEALECLPEGMVVHRMTGDGDKRLLIAPLWSADKKKTINGLYAVLRARGMEI
ncbi:MAG: TIGR01212 family radical SAM protein [Clostridia bacterium]|nr:TIGR01212 family radical SAM protein [Clostridia bacterium]